MEKLAYMMGK